MHIDGHFTYHTTPKWIWIKSSDLRKRSSKPSKLMPKGSKKPCLKIPPRKNFFWHWPHPGLNQGPLDLRSNALPTEPQRQKVLQKKLWPMNITRFLCNSFMNRSFYHQNFLPPWLSQQRVRPQIQRSLVQSRVGAMSKKILRGGIFKHGFLEPLGIKFEGLDRLFHRSELFIQIYFGVVWRANFR